MKVFLFIILKLFSQVYEEISNHFNETRHKQWPSVTKFLRSLEKGTLLLDVGCGNGKYLYGDLNIYKVLLFKLFLIFYQLGNIHIYAAERMK